MRNIPETQVSGAATAASGLINKAPGNRSQWWKLGRIWTINNEFLQLIFNQSLKPRPFITIQIDLEDRLREFRHQLMELLLKPA